nr:E3 SUMO-protein ligase SIZ1-like isoform X2 [Tanacetum cinerariifolium]
MDLVATYKEKLAHFRIKELKDILTPLGLSKQGKKQDLVDRILAIIADDRVSGMWAKKNAVRKEEVKDKVRCLCGSTSKADSMIKCEDKKCNVWQHISMPVSANPVQSVEKTFQLTKMERELLAKAEFELQAWCMLLNDKVSFRMQWPQYADLQVNGMPVRAINRPGSQLLGANGRDDGPIITPCTRDGSNKISLAGCDARVFCLGVRIARRRTFQQILNLIPKESDGERFEDAVARVCRCVGGGPATENADSDSDLEVVSDSIPVNLRCPMSGSRMKIAGRFKPCAHMGCFDLEVFVQMNQRSRKWQCPICLKNYALENVIIDPYFTRITTKMRNCGEDVTEIEVKPDGSWRVKAEKGQKSLGQLGEWHKPNGTLCVPVEVESKPKLEAPKQVKQEGGAEGHSTGLKLGIKKNSNGIWEVSKPEKFVNNGTKEILMSSSATGSGRDGEDPSINQNGGGHFGHSTTNGADFGSLSPNMNLTVADADIIVLSDSEDETENPVSSEPVYSKNGIEDVGDRVAFSAFPHTEDPALNAGGSSCLGLFNTNDDDFGVPFWSLPSTSQMGPSFQLFGSDENVHHGLGGPTSMDDFTLLTDEIGMHSAPPVHDSSLYQSNLDVNDGLVDNPLAFGHDDPSLQLFLPTRPSETAKQAESRNQPAASNGLNGDNDWISLSLGGGSASEDNCKPATINGLNSIQPPP